MVHFNNLHFNNFIIVYFICALQKFIFNITIDGRNVFVPINEWKFPLKINRLRLCLVHELCDNLSTQISENGSFIWDCPIFLGIVFICDGETPTLFDLSLFLIYAQNIILLPLLLSTPFVSQRIHVVSARGYAVAAANERPSFLRAGFRNSNKSRFSLMVNSSCFVSQRDGLIDQERKYGEAEEARYGSAPPTRRGDFGFGKRQIGHFHELYSLANNEFARLRSINYCLLPSRSSRVRGTHARRKVL